MNRSEGNAVVKLVDNLIASALEHGASDIHLEPERDKLRVRFRVDGILCTQDDIDVSLANQVASRIKILSNIDVAKKRVPQDGKFQIHSDDSLIDFRVSTFPGLYGENIVIRILDRGAHSISLGHLGFSPRIRSSFENLIRRSQGFFLVSGPTGSGKTTTLYAALSDLNSPDVNIITLEDPVEYDIKGVTQGQINPAAGFTFEKGMRALLRQDPDIVMLGEIRDKQTAQIAIEAALTGHLVFSTVHANNASSVVMRLMDMGIEPFLINAALTGVLAQRLARRICDDCKVEYKPNEQERAILDALHIATNVLYRGAGCATCHNHGYKGRIGIFELLTISNELRSLIIECPAYEAIETQARTDGMRTLMEDGVQKVQDGLITLQELARVVS
ncbi:type II/IV secretion system protein [Candidatus Dependentiae bacterium]|nr:type II/IV secretion system protein [Candidatus Dependentiae bacterium]